MWSGPELDNIFKMKRQQGAETILLLIMFIFIKSEVVLQIMP